MIKPLLCYPEACNFITRSPIGSICREHRIENYDTMHRSKCAATYRAQLMSNRCGDNTVSLPGIANILVLQRHNKFSSCRNTHLLTFRSYMFSYLAGSFSDLMELDDRI